jgi:hypothetical protein
MPRGRSGVIEQFVMVWVVEHDRIAGEEEQLPSP